MDTSDEKDFVNKINQDKSKNFSFINDSLLKNVHQKIHDKTFRVNNKTASSSKSFKNSPKNGQEDMVTAIIEADKAVKAAVQNLILALADLGDKQIAQKLIANHIMFLNDIFKDFE